MEGRFFTPGSITQMPFWGLADGALRTAAATGPLHDPPLEPRDEAVFLLTAAAEIEHALMVQYLYAVYSIRVADPNRDELQRVQSLLTQIAREEMGHLATVQNLLHLVGGPLNFNRESSPFASAIYPFRFTLE
ncbi:MAG: ferritin-like domain-containing protein, partial [Pseudonocardia sp.]